MNSKILLANAYVTVFICLSVFGKCIVFEFKDNFLGYISQKVWNRLKNKSAIAKYLFDNSLRARFNVSENFIFIVEKEVGSLVHKQNGQFINLTSEDWLYLFNKSEEVASFFDVCVIFVSHGKKSLRRMGTVHSIILQPSAKESLEYFFTACALFKTMSELASKEFKAGRLSAGCNIWDRNSVVDHYFTRARTLCTVGHYFEKINNYFFSDLQPQLHLGARQIVVNTIRDPFSFPEPWTGFNQVILQTFVDMFHC